MTGQPEQPHGAERARGDVEVMELSGAQQAFARRVAESKATAPHVYFEHPLSDPPELATLVAAVAQSLRDVPILNGSYRDGRAELYSRVNLAVGVDTGATLAFPVIRDADGKDAEAIRGEIAALADEVRVGALAAPAFAGATFTVIDMSSSGAAAFGPVIARGQAATLGVGTERLTLACDNRIVQAGQGAAFLACVVERL